MLETSAAECGFASAKGTVRNLRRHALKMRLSWRGGRAAGQTPRRAIPRWSARHRLVCTRLVRVRVGRLEKLTELLA
jgi:hypothetical protein